MKVNICVLILLIISHLAFGQSASTRVVEEVVAVVDRTPLLASDITLAEILKLVDRPYSATEADHRSALLDARIRLEVQFRDLETSGVLYRLDLDVAATRRGLLDRVGGLAAIRPKLEAAGLGDTDIDELALRLSAVNAYAEQRLRPRVAVTMAEIEAAYRSLADELQARAEPPPPLTAVHEQLHRLVAERKLNDEIERWVERAFAERDVTRFVR